MFALNRLLQNHPTGAEVTLAWLLFFRGDLADVGGRQLINIVAAFRTFADRLHQTEIDRIAAFTDRAFVFVPIKLNLKRVVHAQIGVERAAQFRAKTLQVFHLLVADERLGFFNRQLPTRQNFPESKIAFRAREFLVVLLHFAAALRARRREISEVAGHCVALETLGARHDIFCHRGDVSHETLARDLAFFHAGKLGFPVRGELRLRELRHIKAVEQRNQREGLRRRFQRLFFADQILLHDQALDDRGACGGRSEPFFTHGRAQLFVFNRFARAFHR